MPARRALLVAPRGFEAFVLWFCVIQNFQSSTKESSMRDQADEPWRQHLEAMLLGGVDWPRAALAWMGWRRAHQMALGCEGLIFMASAFGVGSFWGFTARVFWTDTGPGVFSLGLAPIFYVLWEANSFVGLDESPSGPARKACVGLGAAVGGWGLFVQAWSGAEAARAALAVAALGAGLGMLALRLALDAQKEQNDWALAWRRSRSALGATNDPCAVESSWWPPRGDLAAGASVESWVGEALRSGAPKQLFPDALAPKLFVPSIWRALRWGMAKGWLKNPPSAVLALSQDELESVAQKWAPAAFHAAKERHELALALGSEVSELRPQDKRRRAQSL
jgi:hypothetical protein